MEEVQFWISRSEAKIQDRTLDPHYLKTNLNEIQSEITGISEQLDNLLANGKVISEKTECSQEKELVLSTTTNLTEQLGQLKQLIQDKKNAANDAIDAWQRFLQFHAAVESWCSEKETFLAEPFSFTNLSSAKLKLQDYTTSIKSIKTATKNIGEMERELKKINQVGSSGDLADKLSEVEREKGELEAQLMEKNAILSEMTEEWDQCEKKLKETKSWVAKARESLESLANKKRPLRDQLNMRDKMTSDIRVQSKRVTMALEKLKVGIFLPLHDTFLVCLYCTVQFAPRCIYQRNDDWCCHNSTTEEENSLSIIFALHNNVLDPSGASTRRGDKRAGHPEAGPGHLRGVGDAGRGGEGLRRGAGGLPRPAGPVPEYDCEPEAVDPGL